MAIVVECDIHGQNNYYNGDANNIDDYNGGRVGWQIIIVMIKMMVVVVT